MQYIIGQYHGGKEMNWIQGDKFITIADFTFAPEKRLSGDYDGLANTLNLFALKEVNIVYTHTMYVKQLFKLISEVDRQFIIITHNSDVNIDKSFTMPKNVLKWYSQNVGIVDYKIESLPIGLENDRWFKKINKKEKMNALLLQPKIDKNLVYMNHNIYTNVEKRRFVYQLLENKDWVTVERGSNGHEFDQYLNDVYNHKFVICPEGNGMDTHRTWETLYMNTIPIEKRNINNQFYTDLPICFVDDWEEITEEFLNRWLIGNSWQDWNMEKLDFEYWKNKISK
jgi:hypothetical protein